MVSKGKFLRDAADFQRVYISPDLTKRERKQELQLKASPAMSLQKTEMGGSERQRKGRWYEYNTIRLYGATNDRKSNEEDKKEILNIENKTATDHLKVLYTNADSFSNKLSDLQILVESFSPNVIVLTETTLK